MRNGTRKAPVLFAACVLTAMGLAQTTPAHAIIGGTLAHGDPAVVALSYRFIGPTCSGSLVAPKLVLTAAHCLKYGDPSGVLFGSDADHAKSVGVERTMSHPKFASEEGDALAKFDVGVVVLAETITGVKPLRTNHAALDPSFIGRPVRHVGFGTTSELALDMGTKRTLSHPITKVDDANIYTGSKAAGICNGDSGGPALAVIEGEPDEQIVSIVSEGLRCIENSYDIRLDVPEVSAWLDPLIAAYGGPKAPTPGPGGGAPPETPGAEPGATPPEENEGQPAPPPPAGGTEPVPGASACSVGPGSRRTTTTFRSPLLAILMSAIGFGYRRRTTRRSR